MRISNSLTIKIVKKLENYYKRLFSYPSFKYNKNLKNNYWQKRKHNILKSQPNDFQRERARLVFENIETNDEFLFDIGSGDGSQLISIRNRLPQLKILASDNDEYACELVIKNNFKCFLLKNENEIFKLLKKHSPKYISIFEVLEHMKSPEDFLIKLLKQKNITIFASVPNSGFLIYRIRFLLGRFPTQWIASPDEHLRFWTYKDLKWWFKYLNILDKVKIKPYMGLPLLNKVNPNLFAEGLFFIIKN